MNQDSNIPINPVKEDLRNFAIFSNYAVSMCTGNIAELKLRIFTIIDILIDYCHHKLILNVSYSSQLELGNGQQDTFHAYLYAQLQNVHHQQSQLCKPMSCTRDLRNASKVCLI